jgi:hypothetical protein
LEVEDVLHQNRPHIASPLLYAAVAALVAIFVVAVMAVLERTVGLRTWQRVGDIDAAIVLAVGGTILFSVATRYLVRLERLHQPSVRDHFRHSALLYMAGMITIGGLAVTYSELNGALQYGYVAILFVVSVLGILVNATCLLVTARRNESDA